MKISKKVSEDQLRSSLAGAYDAWIEARNKRIAARAIAMAAEGAWEKAEAAWEKARLAWEKARDAAGSFRKEETEP